MLWCSRSAHFMLTVWWHLKRVRFNSWSHSATRLLVFSLFLSTSPTFFISSFIFILFFLYFFTYIVHHSNSEHYSYLLILYQNYEEIHNYSRRQCEEERMPSFIVEHSYIKNRRKRCRGTPTGKTPIQAFKKSSVVRCFDIYNQFNCWILLCVNEFLNINDDVNNKCKSLLQ